MWRQVVVKKGQNCVHIVFECPPLKKCLTFLFKAQFFQAPYYVIFQNTNKCFGCIHFCYKIELHNPHYPPTLKNIQSAAYDDARTVINYVSVDSKFSEQNFNNCVIVDRRSKFPNPLAYIYLTSFKQKENLYYHVQPLYFLWYLSFS